MGTDINDSPGNEQVQMSRMSVTSTGSFNTSDERELMLARHHRNRRKSSGNKKGQLLGKSTLTHVKANYLPQFQIECL